MKPIFVVLAALALTTSAMAQSNRWIDPTGVWSLDLGASGWAWGEGLPPGETVLLAVPFVSPPDTETRVCLGEQSMVGAAGRAPVQGYAEQFDGSQAAALLARFQPRDIVVGHRQAGGVGIAEMSAWSARSERVRALTFETASSAGVLRTNIICFAAPQTPPDKVVEIDAVLASLQINGIGAAP